VVLQPIFKASVPTTPIFKVTVLYLKTTMVNNLSNPKPQKLRISREIHTIYRFDLLILINGKNAMFFSPLEVIKLLNIHAKIVVEPDCNKPIPAE
jgi:hypothetical protein